MAKELAFALINPYTIAKSRTGGVIARYIGRTDLDLVAARMFGPSAELVAKYADLVQHADSRHGETCQLIADYIRKSYAPNPITKRPNRVMLLLFEGENAVKKMWRVTGSATLKWGSGETVRDTYGDYIMDSQNKVQYFEPAVLVAPTKERALATMSLWAKHSKTAGGIIETAIDVPEGKGVERTLVMLKPDNFRFPSARPGNIIDLLSSSGLRITAVKKFCMTVSQAQEFYRPVRESLESKFRDLGAERAGSALLREFGFEVPRQALDKLCDQLAPLLANAQFESIIEFMTGYRPSECSTGEKSMLGSEGCLALVYEGIDAVQKIRSLVGLTDPSKAKPGSVRREFGSDIMVNAAHASDSRENAEREIKIIDLELDTIKPLVDRYCGSLFSKVLGIKADAPRVGCELLRKVKTRWKARIFSTAE